MKDKRLKGNRIPSPLTVITASDHGNAKENVITAVLEGNRISVAGRQSRLRRNNELYL
jgi:hypothetical protein